MERRFLLGTLSHHAGPGLQAVEYTYGDAISGTQMRYGFFEVLPHISEPTSWVLRPQDDNQVSKVRAVEGSVPMVGPNAPFEDVTYQPLTEGVAYGTLRFVPASELEQTALGQIIADKGLDQVLGVEFRVAGSGDTATPFGFWLDDILLKRKL